MQNELEHTLIWATNVFAKMSGKYDYFILNKKWLNL